MSNGEGKVTLERVLLMIITGIISVVAWFVMDMNGKIFHHLTNEEIHIPRSTVVTKAEFELMARMRESQLTDMREMLKDQLSQIRIEMRNPQVYRK